MVDGAARRLSGIALLGYVLVSPLLARNPVVVCPFRRVTGRPCPFCGMTRSLSALLHGKLRESVAFHPLGWAVVAAAFDLVLRPSPARRLTTSGGI